MSIANDKIVNLQDAKVLYDDLRGRIKDNSVVEVLDTPADIQSFSDAARFPMELKVGIDPVQDLHGYDRPWPAGGGKNLINKDDSAIKVQLYIDPTTGVSKTASQLSEPYRSVVIPCKASTSYIASNAIITTIRMASFVNMPSNNGTPTVFNIPSGTTPIGTGVTITTGASDTYLMIQMLANDDVTDGVTSDLALAELMVEEGSTAHTWEPYSNVCPISGFTGANVTVAGKNLCTSLENGSVSTTNGENSDYATTQRLRTGWIRVKGNTQYTINCTGDGITPQIFAIQMAGYHTGSVVTADGWYELPYTFLTDENTKYIRISFRGSGNPEITPASVSNAQIEEGTTATAYEPISTTYPIAFPTSTGTVYGGELTVHSDGSGELAVNKVLFEFDGSEDENIAIGQYGGSNKYVSFSLSDSIYKNRIEAPSISNAYLENGISGTNTNIGFSVYNHSQIRCRYELDNSITLEIARAYFASNPVQFVVPLLDNSITSYVLTPRQVFALLDTNNVWADCGQINYLEYVRDTVGEVIPNRFDGIEQDIVETNTYEKTISEANAIQTFDDGANWPMGMQIAVDPVQDLHGYSNPWPGGGGKNLLPITVDGIKGTNTAGTWSGNSYTLNGIKFDINTDGSNNVIGIAVSGTATGTGRFYVVDSADITLPGSCIFSLHASVNPINMDCTIKDGDNRLGYINATSFVNGEQLLTGTHITQFIFYFNANMSQSLTMYPMIRLSTVSDSTFEPYSNICPITGWTGANVCVFGSKNIATTQLTIGGYFNEDGTIHSSSNYRYSTELTVVKQNTNYVCSMEKLSTAIRQFFVVTYDNRKNFVRTISVFTSDLKGRVQGTFQTSANEYYIRFAVPKDGAANNIQIELGTVASAFENYAGATYPITFPTSAGTVYGGNLTVNKDGTGTLVVKEEKVSFGGDRNWTLISARNGFRLASVLQSHESGYPTKCEWLKTKTTISTETGVVLGSENSHLYVDGVINVIPGVTNLETWKTYLNNNPLVLTKPISPIAYSLTPGQVLSLIGQNNVWADTGDILSLTYNSKQGMEFIREDTAGQIAPVQAELTDAEEALAIVIDGDVAPTGGLSKGTYVFLRSHSTLDRGLYRVKSAISAGTSITSSNTSAESDGIANKAMKATHGLISTGFSTGWSASWVVYQKVGKVVTISFSGLKSTSDGSGWTTAITLPADLRTNVASQQTNALILNDDEGALAEVKIQDNVFAIYAPAANVKYWGGITYIIE